MNNAYNYSFLSDVESKKTMQHFAFEKGGTVISVKSVEPVLKKQNSFKILFKKIFSPRNFLFGK